MAADDRSGERVLLVTPTRRDAEVTCQLLGKARIDCLPCANLEELAGEIREGVGAIVLTDAALAASGADALLSALASQPAWSDVPTVLLTGDRQRSDLAQRTLSRLTNVTLLDLPSLAAVSGVLAAVTVLACAIPAWRAVRVPVTTALRQE